MHKNKTDKCERDLRPEASVYIWNTFQVDTPLVIPEKWGLDRQTDGHQS